MTVTGIRTAWVHAATMAAAWPGSANSAAPAPVLQIFATGHPMLMSISAAPCASAARAASAIAAGTDPNSWIPVSCSAGIQAQHVDRAGVAMGDAHAGDHLRHRQPGAVTLGLQSERRVGDTRQRRLQDAVGHRQRPDRERLGQRPRSVGRRECRGVGDAVGDRALHALFHRGSSATRRAGRVFAFIS